jgi:hypothetical protein
MRISINNFVGFAFIIYGPRDLFLVQVPKLLLHRLFPNVRYSIWIDGKLKLVRDPYQVLER